MIFNENTALFIEATAGILTLAIIALTFLFVRLNRRTKTTTEALSHSYNILELEIANHRKLAIEENEEIKQKHNALRVKVAGIDLRLMDLERDKKFLQDMEAHKTHAKHQMDIVNLRAEQQLKETELKNKFTKATQRNKKGQFTKAKKK